MELTARSCNLRYFQFPNYWEEITEVITSADDAINRMEEIEGGYESKEGEHIAVFVDDSNGNTLLVGLARSMRMITFIHRLNEHDWEYQYAVGDKTKRGAIPFLIPEWTEYSRKCLIPKSKGQQVVREWIQNGILSTIVDWTYDLL